jgi:hypothetical protein
LTYRLPVPHGGCSRSLQSEQKYERNIAFGLQENLFFSGGRKNARTASPNSAGGSPPKLSEISCAWATLPRKLRSATSTSIRYPFAITYVSRRSKYLHLLSRSLLTGSLKSQLFAMAEIDITASSWKLVQVGRVVLIRGGLYSGKLAVIAEIIDHKRVRLPDLQFQWKTQC